ncbi:MAG: peptidylprolyl isomerase [Firmicutes bacterium]|nr:peptidylprolyl isomerase [Bacillota bacterium]
MKKKKQDKAKVLTANERKELRRKELEMKQGKSAKLIYKKETQDELVTSQVVFGGEFSENAQDSNIAAFSNNENFGANDNITTANGTATATKNPPNLKTLITIMVVSVFLIAGLIVSAILVPRCLYNPFTHIENPVVRFTLNTGEQIDIVVFENEVPHAATNFLYLARIGFFNDTIIFDSTHYTVRFGQFEDNTFRSFRTTNQSFLNGLPPRYLPSLTPERANHATQNWSPFDYRVALDVGTEALFNIGGVQRRNRFNERGLVSAINSLSHTEFQIATVPNAIPNIMQSHRPANTPGGGRTLNMPGRFIGEVTGSSLEVLDRIANLPQQASGISPHPLFRPPVEEGGSNIYIRSTEVLNENTDGWRNFSWDEYFLGHTPTRITTWTYGGGFNAVRDVDRLITITNPE